MSKNSSCRWRASVDDGAITGRTTADTALKGHNTFLVWQGGTPADLELRAKFKLQGETRASSIGVNCSTRRSLSAAIRPTSIPPAGTSGSITRRNAEDYRAGPQGRDWRGRRQELHRARRQGRAPQEDRPERLNEYTIIAKCNHLKYIVNITLISEVIDNQSSKSSATGILALQLHQGPPMVIQFKDIRLKELK